VWVIEIRGYTDHHAGPTFIKNALIRNLQKFDAFARDEKKVGKFIAGAADPVKGKVSHAFVYNFWEVDNAQPNSFLHINRSFLDQLLGGPAKASGQGGPGGAGSALGMPPGGGSSTPAAGMPLGGGDTTSAAPAATFGPAWRGLTDSSANTPGAGGGKQDKTGRRRCEFVVMLLWREPVPSGSPPPGEAAAPESYGPAGGVPAGAGGSAAGPPR
jgi:hypothetical protein